jgi:hypothetical protein
MSSKGPDFAKLGPNNYPTWSGEMEAWLRATMLWRLVSESSKSPTMPTAVTEAATARLENWQDKEDKAAGWIFLMVEPEQRVHLESIKSDPVAMWKKLNEVHMVKRAGARFNAYDDLFSIRKQEEESLQSLTNRIDSASRTIINLRSTGFTLDNLDEELFSMTMIRALPSDYANFVSALLLKDKLDKSMIIEAFQTEETQRRRRSDTEDTPTSNKALAASSSSHSHSHKHSTLMCNFCEKPGHTQEKCWKYEKAMKEARKPRPPAAKPVQETKEFAGQVSF